MRIQKKAKVAGYHKDVWFSKKAITNEVIKNDTTKRSSIQDGNY